MGGRESSGRGPMAAACIRAGRPPYSFRDRPARPETAMNRVRCPACGTPKNFRNASYGTVTRCQNCGKKFLLPERPKGTPLLTCLVGVGAVGLVVLLCCGGVGLL